MNDGQILKVIRIVWATNVTYQPNFSGFISKELLTLFDTKWATFTRLFNFDLSLLEIGRSTTLSGSFVNTVSNSSLQLAMVS